MAQASMITDEVKAVIGSETIGLPELIEMGTIRAYAKAIAWPDPPDPLYVDPEASKNDQAGGIIAPWTFFTTLGKNVSSPPLPLPVPISSFNGGSDYECFQSIRPGDSITTKSKIVGISERKGRAGMLVFIETDRTFVNQRGETVGIFHSRSIRQY